MQHDKDSKETVRLGLMPPLSGLVELYGQEICWAARIAVDEINERGGVLGKKLELIIEDDGSMPEPAVKAAEKLVFEHQCVAMIGNLLSNARIDVAARVAGPNHIPYLNFSFYEGSISNRYFFSFSALPNQQIDKMIPYMAEHFGPKMYFAGNNYEWPRGSIDAAKRSLLDCGGEVVGEEYFDIGCDDLQSVLDKVKKSGADVFVPYAAGMDQINLLNLFTEMGLKNQMAVVMGHYDEAMVSLLKPEVRSGLYSSNTYFMTIDNEKNHQYLKRLAEIPEVVGIWPNGNGTLTNFSEGTYVCVHAFARAAEMAGSLDAEDLVNALEHVSVDAPQGKVEMDPETHHATVNAWLSRCNQAGIFEIIKSFGQIKPVIPERYLLQNRISHEASADLPMQVQGADWQLVTVIPYQVEQPVEENASALVANDRDARQSLNHELIRQLSNDTGVLAELARSGMSGEFELSLDMTQQGKEIFRLTPLYNEQGCSHFAISRIGISNDKYQIPSSSKSNSGVMPADHHTVAMMITDTEGVISYVNGKLLDLWGIRSADMLISHHVSEFFCMPDEYKVDKLFIDAVASTDCLYAAKQQNGGIFKIDISVDPIIGSSENQIGFVLSCYEPGVDSEDDMYVGMTRQILGSADVAIISINEDGHIIQVNNTACELFGYDNEEFKGMSVHQLLPPHMREQHKVQIKEFFQGHDVMRSMGSRAEIAGYKRDGTFFPAEASITKIRSGEKWIMVATLRDITERKNIEAELIRDATHDPLTKLPNRMLIHDRVSSALSRSQRTGKSVALMFVDVDEFKLINDNYGHDIGDQLLVAISNELVNIVRPGDTVARFGGDEFVVMCDQITDWNIVTKLAERIVDRLKHPLEIAGHEFFATVSIGVAIGHGQTHKAEEILRNADAAMYKAKERGRDGWMIFSDEIGENSRMQLKIATGLRTAEKNNEFYTVLQPIVNSVTGEIVGAETLLRWRYGNEEISPAVFIPIAEMTGSILSIGEWVFRQACITQADWASSFRGRSMPYLSVNLSARQLNEPGLVDVFTNIIHETGADPEQIVLEITETTLMKDVDYTINVLNELGRLGLHVAVDDFGTGYSSLSHLKRLPVNTLKVDRIFVDGIEKSEDTHSITLAIVTMAHSLGLRVTAEGVETKEQLDCLKSMNCDTIQGYYFYKPMPIDDFNRIFLQQSVA